MSNGLNGQDSQLGLLLKINQLDYNKAIENLDNSYAWDSWYTTGISTLALEFKTACRKNKSIKTSLGHSFNGTWYGYTDDQGTIYHEYSSRYINFRILGMYNVSSGNKGLRLAFGPSIYKLLNHKQETVVNFTSNEVNSILEDRFNNISIYLDLEISYAFKLFPIFSRLLYLEIGYIPQVKIVGFVNENNKNLIMPRGLSLSASVDL